MATEEDTKELENDDEVDEVDENEDEDDELDEINKLSEIDKISQLHEIIAQNLTIGIAKLGDDFQDLMDDHVDMKSNASGHWRRGSVSYSQPNSPKGNPSLSPVSSVSSISELSTENREDSNSESCTSLNSATSNESVIIKKKSFMNIKRMNLYQHHFQKHKVTKIYSTKVMTNFHHLLHQN